MSEFVDQAQVHARGGDGGAGVVSFRREAHVDRGGPDGGDGGDGGDVWLFASTDAASLLPFRDHPHRRAEDGAHGKGKAKHGASGRDQEVPVPVGTVVKDRDGTVLADLSPAGTRFLAAAGGRGGRGNARFLSNRRRAPAFAEQGEHGEERWLDLELKLVADVAIVGLPNAGKSTLISRISASKAKVADYPFTTLVPNLGVVRVSGGDGGDVEMVVADIPGLVEGASEGKGLGHLFLRHVERARALVVLCDLAPADPESPLASVLSQRDVLLTEIERYRPELLERPRIVVGSKCDVAPAKAQLGEDGLDLAISAVTGEGVDMLVREMARLVTEARKVAPVPSGEVVVHRLEPEGVKAERLPDGSFAVNGRQAQRAVAVNDLNAPGAADHVARRLKRLGVEKALARAGACSGDTVHIGGFTFTYEPD